MDVGHCSPVARREARARYAIWYQRIEAAAWVAQILILAATVAFAGWVGSRTGSTADAMKVAVAGLGLAMGVALPVSWLAPSERGGVRIIARMARREEGRRA